MILQGFEDHRRPVLAEQRDALAAVGGLDDAVALEFKGDAEDLADRGGVVDEEDGHRYRFMKDQVAVLRDDAS
jgi:hypothetical protein